MSTMSKTRLDEIFPSLNSLPKKSAPQPANLSGQSQSSQAQIQKQIEQIKESDINNPDKMYHTSISQQDFTHLLSVQMNCIPAFLFEPDSDAGNNLPPEKIPASYPSQPYIKIMQPEFFTNLDVETLFYIFFCNPGTIMQYYAGEQLKAHGWLYHTKYQTWFHHDGEPSEATKTYEIGNYKYYDHSTDNWCYRQKTRFRLDYDAIEK